MPLLSSQNFRSAPVLDAPAGLSGPKRPARFSLLLGLVLALGSGSWAGGRPSAPIPAPAPGDTPAAVLRAFDSLLQAGDFARARVLCTGQVLRMFDFIAMTQSRMAGLVDSSLSSDKQLEEAVAGDWAYIKVASHLVFRQPFLGQKEMHAVQVVHFYRSERVTPGRRAGPQGRAWLIAEFEELEKPGAPVKMRTGAPQNRKAPEQPPATGGQPPPGSVPAGIFPVSSMAPAGPVEADWMQYRLKLKNGASLEGLCPLDSGQKKIGEGSSGEWILENRKTSLASLRTTGSRGASLPDSLGPFLASNAYLVLDDSLLQATARRIAGKEKDPARVTGRIYRWVSEGFRFQLGTVLFGTSREVLRGMTGDCSEAAILTAALLRARGIPSRLALGFASVGRGVFIGHAWTEAWLGRWVGVDAALRQYPAGVERVKLAELDGKADMRVAGTNLMMAVLSNLDLEILEMRKNGRAIPLQRVEGNAGEGAEYFEKILSGVEGKQ